MLLQAYDFLRLHLDHGCDLQIGGSDQWGNITMGVELVRKVCGDEVWGLTTPLIVKADGTKYGKTETGTVWLDPARTSPFAMYQFFVNTPDEQVGELLRFLTFLDHDEIEALDAETAEHPQRRAAQRALARAVVALVHGEAEVAKCEEASAALFGEEIAGAQRGDAAGRHRGRADHRRSRGPSCSTASPSSTSSSAPAWSSRRRRRGAPSTRVAPTSTTCGRPTPAAPSAPPTSCTTATSCCARAGGRSTSSGPHEAPVPGRRPSSLMLGSALTLTSCAGADQQGSPAHRMSVWVSGTGFGEDIGTLIADNARVAQGRAQRHGRRARRLRHPPQRRRDGQRRAAVARPRRHRPPHQGLRARGHGGQRVLQRRRHRTRSCWPSPSATASRPRRSTTRRCSASGRSTARPVPTTTTTDNSTGGIFG